MVYRGEKIGGEGGRRGRQERRGLNPEAEPEERAKRGIPKWKIQGERDNKERSDRTSKHVLNTY